MSIAEKVIVITGAASGIGLSLAKKLSGSDNRLVLVDLDYDRLESIREYVDAESLLVKCDVGREEDCANLERVVGEKCGPPQILFNNAGVISQFANVWKAGQKEWDRVFSTNVYGVANMLRCFVPSMLDQDEPSRIVNTASEAAFTSRAFVGIYHASKHAVLAITEALAQELAYANANLKVSVLCPGGVNTNVLEALDSSAGEASEDGSALEKVYRSTLPNAMSPDEVADHVINSILNDDYYILPDTQVSSLPQSRADAVKNNTYPSLPPNMARRMKEWL